MYLISGWDKRYEVSSKGREAREGNVLRAGALTFIRLRVHGHEQGLGYRKMQLLAKERSMEVFGIFCKFLELAGNQPRENRGQLLNEKDEPATAKDLAFILSVPIEQINHALEVLTDKSVRWLHNTETTTQLNTTQHNSTQHKAPGISGNFREFPGNKTQLPAHKGVKDNTEAAVLSELTPSDIFTYWNSVCKKDGIKAVLDMSDNRRRHLKARLAEPQFANSWREIIDRVAASKFCQGGGPHGWITTFDWIIANNNNYLKVLEGNYGNRKNNKVAGTTDRHRDDEIPYAGEGESIIV